MDYGINDVFSESHPSRVRGLKYGGPAYHQRLKDVAPFAGAWIEMAMWPAFTCRERASHPSRVRGLKFNAAMILSWDSGSHPSRVRGLKYSYREGS